MQPARYGECYLNLYHYTRFGTEVRIGIRNYLQNAKGQQSINALALQGRLFNAINRKLGKSGSSVPANFDIFQYPYIRNNLSRVFMGKGAPDEIQDCLWLMDQLEMIDNMTVNWVCDQNLGVDCGGFVCNYWGMGRPSLGAEAPIGWSGMLPRDIWNMNPQNRRTHHSQVQTGDAAIFFKDVKDNDPNIVARKLASGAYDTASGSQAFHIGLVDDLVTRTGEDGESVWLGITQSSGAKRSSGFNGVHSSVGTFSLQSARGLVYCRDDDTGNRIYFTGPSSQGSPYLPWGVGEE